MWFAVFSNVVLSGKWTRIKRIYRINKILQGDLSGDDLSEEDLSEKDLSEEDLSEEALEALRALQGLEPNWSSR